MTENRLFMCSLIFLAACGTQDDDRIPAYCSNSAGLSFYGEVHKTVLESATSIVIQDTVYNALIRTEAASDTSFTVSFIPEEIFVFVAVMGDTCYYRNQSQNQSEIFISRKIWGVYEAIDENLVTRIEFEGSALLN